MTDLCLYSQNIKKQNLKILLTGQKLPGCPLSLGFHGHKDFSPSLFLSLCWDPLDQFSWRKSSSAIFYRIVVRELSKQRMREWENCVPQWMEPLKIVAGVFRSHFGIYFSFFAWLEPVENSYSCSHNYKASWGLPSFKIKTQEALYTAENQQWHLVTADLPFGAPIWPLCWSSCSYCKYFLNCGPRDWPFPYHRTSSSER